MSTISEDEFEKLCRDIYADRQQIYSFHPNAPRREALLWMLLGCLLSVPDSEHPTLHDGTHPDPYAEAIRELLRGRTQPPFDPRPHLSKLAAELEAEA
jgi:hypothetical protein